MSKYLVDSVNPNGNLQACVVEEYGSCYMYLQGQENEAFGTRAVWVRNLLPAPAQWDKTVMTRGEPPLNIAPHCRYPQGQASLQADQLKLVWLPEGNGVALYEAEELLAIIPPWSGYKGFDGYARDAVGTGLAAWELTVDNVLHQRFAEAQRYWHEWEFGSEWPRIQDSMTKTLHSILGVESNYYAIDGGNWPPKALLRIPRDTGVVLVSIGNCIRPQPNVERGAKEPAAWRRIELGVVLPTRCLDEQVKSYASFLSSLSNYPWEHYTWFGHHHTISCHAWPNPKYTHALLTNTHPQVPDIDFEHQYGDPINMLWCIPITSEEEAMAVREGSAQLAERLPATRWQDC